MFIIFFDFSVNKHPSRSYIIYILAWCYTCNSSTLMGNLGNCCSTNHVILNRKLVSLPGGETTPNNYKHTWWYSNHVLPISYRLSTCNPSKMETSCNVIVHPRDKWSVWVFERHCSINAIMRCQSSCINLIWDNP